MAANVKQAELRGRYQQIIDQDRGRLIDAFENDDAESQITLQWQIHLAFNIRVVLLPIT